MKIAIIEDRIKRVEKYEEFELKNCKSVAIITGNDFDHLILSLESNNAIPLDQYNCIASHRSAMSNEVRDYLKEYCRKKKKPLIFFSGSITSSVFKDVGFPFLHINSKDFYSENLKLFIIDCEESNSVNLGILQFGKKWKTSLLLNLRNKIAIAENNQILKNKNHAIVDEKELINRIKDLQIDPLIKEELRNERTDSILNRDDIAKITFEEMQEIKSTINRLINKMA